MNKYEIDADYLGEVVSREIHSAETWMDGELSEQQASNLDYYYGKEFGNEEDGFSQVVTRDVLETVEGIMPELMKIFTGPDQVVEFDPQGPEDEDKVEIEAKYINHVFMNRGDGYKVLYDWFKDALLMKNGVIHTGWEEKEEVQFRHYAGLTQAEFDVLKDGESDDSDLFAVDYEIESHEELDDDLFNVRVKIWRQRGNAKVTPIPSEEFLIKERSTSIKDATFVAWQQEKTRGELIEMGFDEDDIQDATIESTQTDEISQARFSDPSETDSPESVNGSEYDKYVEFTEAYVELYDPKDEKVKIYRCYQIGNKCIDYTEVDRKPFISLSPIMMPHKYVGLAVADLVRDIQEIRSTIFRQMLDNLALQNAGRYTAIEGQVNLQDLIDNRIGGIIRQKMPNAVGRLDTPDLSQFTVPVLEQLYQQKEDRTGVSRMTAGLDENALASHQTASAVNAVMTAAQGKILLIARNFAETGVKELFLELYNLTREHQTRPDLVPISGRYAIVNPGTWVDRHSVHVTVGIGNGNKDQQLMHLSQIQQMLQAVGGTQYGYMIQAENVYHLASEFIKNSGYDNPSKFITHPTQVEPPPPKPDPQLISAQAQSMEAETNQQVKTGSLQLDDRKHEWDKKVDAAEASLEASQKRPVGFGTGK
jgi:hypothetical protein